MPACGAERAARAGLRGGGSGDEGKAREGEGEGGNLLHAEVARHRRGGSEGEGKGRGPQPGSSTPYWCDQIGRAHV